MSAAANGMRSLKLKLMALAAHREGIASKRLASFSQIDDVERSQFAPSIHRTVGRSSR
jgi:hypothetical protein